MDYINQVIINERKKASYLKQVARDWNHKNSLKEVQKDHKHEMWIYTSYIHYSIQNSKSILVW